MTVAMYVWSDGWMEGKKPPAYDLQIFRFLGIDGEIKDRHIAYKNSIGWTDGWICPNLHVEVFIV